MPQETIRVAHEGAIDWLTLDRPGRDRGAGHGARAPAPPDESLSRGGCPALTIPGQCSRAQGGPVLMDARSAEGR
jgi:hypothetical protein